MNEMSIPRPLLTLVSNADERFFPGLSVALASAVAAASGTHDYHFRILDGGLAPGALEHLNDRLSRIASNKGIRVFVNTLQIDEDLLQSLPERRGSRMPYAKLLLPEILPHLDSVIYLDADILCFAGLEKAVPTAGESHWLLAGALDFFDTIEKDCPWLDHLQSVDKRLPYINSGVMWMNLRGLREMGFTHEAIRLRSATGPARHADQAVFNFLCRGKSFVIDDSLNHRTSIGSSRPLCAGSLDLNIHYIGSPKPWLGPPKASNWLAHQLWHQAHTAIFSNVPVKESPPPGDLASIHRKARLYSWINPRRAVHYKNDLHSLHDPGGVRAKAEAYWNYI